MSLIMRNIGVSWRCANLYRTAKFEHAGFGCYQYSYLLNVCRYPGISQDGLAKLIYIHKSTVARQLAALEEKGFVERRPDPEDKRLLRVYPTEKAMAVQDMITGVLQDWDALVTDEFTAEERETLERLTHRLAERAKRVVEALDGGKEE